MKIESQKSHLGLSLIILLLIVSNLLGAYKLLSDTERFSKIFINLSDTSIKLIATVPFLTIVGLVAIYFGKKWGFWLTCFTFTLALFLDIFYTNWYHGFLASVCFVILLYFCWTSGLFTKRVEWKLTDFYWIR